MVVQEPIKPLIHNDAIPDIVDAGTSGSVQDAEGVVFLPLRHI